MCYCYGNLYAKIIYPQRYSFPNAGTFPFLPVFGSVLVAVGDVTMSDVAVVSCDVPATVAELSKNVRQTVVINFFFSQSCAIAMVIFNSKMIYP